MKFRFRIPFTNIMVASRGFILGKLEHGKNRGYDALKPKVWGYILGVYDSSLFDEFKAEANINLRVVP